MPAAAYESAHDLSGLSHDAAITELAWTVLATLESGDPNRARSQVVQALAERFGGRVVLGWRRRGRWQTAVSGRAHVDRRSELGRALSAALAETWLQADLLRWPNSQDTHAPDPPTYRQLASVAGVGTIVGLRLASSNEAAAAAILVLDGAELASQAPEALVREAGPALGGLIQILADASPTILDRWVQRASAVVRGRRRYLALAATGALVAVGLVPVPDRIACPAALEPQLCRYVVAPQDGILQRALVKTGERVVAGQTLAELDPRPLQIEMSLLEAQSDEAARRRDAARAKGQAGQAQLAELELAQATSKINHLEHQLKQLTVASPIDGVVVRGDLERAQGAALARGQSLFEISPLAPLVAELAVPEDEVRLVEAGMPVTLWPAALPGRSLAGTVASVHPRAEVRENQAVFIAEVTVPNEDGALKPGMRATAVVWGDSQPLAWTAIRRPLTRWSRWMWW